MMMGLMEGIVMFAGSCVKSGVSWYTVGWDVANLRCKCSCKVDAGYKVVAERK